MNLLIRYLLIMMMALGFSMPVQGGMPRDYEEMEEVDVHDEMAADEMDAEDEEDDDEEDEADEE